jgi:hypothetical protein
MFGDDMTENKVTIFRAGDFRDLEIIELSRSGIAELLNSMLSERLNPYYSMRDGDTSTWFADEADRSPDLDTHIIYGLEPQPIPKEPLKVEVTRKNLSMLWDEYICTHADERMGFLDYLNLKLFGSEDK